MESKLVTNVKHWIEFLIIHLQYKVIVRICRDVCLILFTSIFRDLLIWKGIMYLRLDRFIRKVLEISLEYQPANLVVLKIYSINVYRQDWNIQLKRAYTDQDNFALNNHKVLDEARYIFILFSSIFYCFVCFHENRKIATNCSKGSKFSILMKVGVFFYLQNK